MKMVTPATTQLNSSGNLPDGGEGGPRKFEGKQIKEYKPHNIMSEEDKVKAM